MVNYLKYIHHNIINRYRKEINSLLDRNFKLTSCKVVAVSVKMDVHIYKHMKLHSMLIRPRKLFNSVFSLKK